MKLRAVLVLLSCGCCAGGPSAPAVAPNVIEQWRVNMVATGGACVARVPGPLSLEIDCRTETDPGGRVTGSCRVFDAATAGEIVAGSHRAGAFSFVLAGGLHQTACPDLSYFNTTGGPDRYDGTFNGWFRVNGSCCSCTGPATLRRI